MKVTKPQIELWRQCVAETGSITQTAACFGVASHMVQRYTHDVLQRYKAERNAKILELRQNGMTMDEIADILNTTEGIVGSICRANGCGGRIRSGWERERTEAQLRGIKKNGQKKKSEGEARYRELVESCGLEYLGGYTNSRGFIKVRYPQCGHEEQWSCVALRHLKRVPSCRQCAKEQRKRKEVERAEQKAEAKEKARIKREAKMAAMQAEKAARIKVCLTCGTAFHPDHGGRDYCSDDCRRKANNRRREARKRGQRRTIQLEQVFQKDGGRCYICGESCDFEDYQIINGAFVVGSTYPTVEHVIPMSLGGDDSWENVRLACHYCNTVKGRKSDVKVEQTGQMAFVV